MWVVCLYVCMKVNGLGNLGQLDVVFVWEFVLAGSPAVLILVSVVAEKGTEYETGSLGPMYGKACTYTLPTF